MKFLNSMVDERVKKLAEILVNYSVKIKKGDVVSISAGPEAEPLIKEIYRLVLKKGAYPNVKVGVHGLSYLYFKHATKEQLENKPNIAMYEAKNTDAWISIGTDYNTRELSNVDPDKMALRSRTTKKVHDTIIDKDNWVYFEYPTAALAQDAETSVEEFENFVYKACLVDWKKERKKQQKLINLLNNTDQVKIIHKDTFLTFSIKGKNALECCGTHNMPDGEVFTEPVKRSVNGHIRYSFPAIKGGREVDGVWLRFRKGKVVEAKATKNPDYLRKMINTDSGSSYIGEFGIGLNYNIKNFVKQILFDEKIGGTIHFALGKSYKGTGGENNSALHWDMIKDMRNGGEIYFDDKLVMKDGKWKIYS
ncbi:aminopeptidase [Candidatus Woesearchaeota archaeon]|nr:aminopeptidase [Candidatus Woesearchaeota archaeon]